MVLPSLTPTHTLTLSLALALALALTLVLILTLSQDLPPSRFYKPLAKGNAKLKALIDPSKGQCEP